MVENHSIQRGEFISFTDLIIIIIRRRLLFAICVIVLLGLSGAGLIYSNRITSFNYEKIITLPYYYDVESAKNSAVVPMPIILNQIASDVLPAAKKNALQNGKVGVLALLNEIHVEPLMEVDGNKSSYQLVISVNKMDFKDKKIFSLVSTNLARSIQDRSDKFRSQWRYMATQNLGFLQGEIKALKAMRGLNMGLNTSASIKKTATEQALSDVYMTSLGFQQKYDQLYLMQIKYVQLEISLKNLVPFNVSPLVSMVGVNKISLKLISIILIVLTFLFSTLLVFLVEFIYRVKLRLKDAR